MQRRQRITFGASGTKQTTIAPSPVLGDGRSYNPWQQTQQQQQQQQQQSQPKTPQKRQRSTSPQPRAAQTATAQAESPAATPREHAQLKHAQSKHRKIDTTSASVSASASASASLKPLVKQSQRQPKKSVSKAPIRSRPTKKDQSWQLDYAESVQSQMSSVAKVMGFGMFKSTHGKQVPGNIEGEARVVRPRKYRQYVNRKVGGLFLEKVGYS